MWNYSQAATRVSSLTSWWMPHAGILYCCLYAESKLTLEIQLADYIIHLSLDMTIPDPAVQLRAERETLVHFSCQRWIPASVRKPERGQVVVFKTGRE
jgi:hypothetical protein